MLSNLLKYIYKRIPDQIKKYYSRIPFPLRAGKSYRDTIKFLRRSQYMTEQALETYQLNKLREILVYSYMKVPYYQNLFKSISFDPFSFKDLSEFERLPILTKKDVFYNYETLISRDCNSLNSYVGHTGGTTGEPLKIMMSLKSHFIEWAFIHELWRRVGFKPGNRRIAFLGVPFKKEETTIYKYNYAHNELQLSPRHLDDKNINKYIYLINKFKPHFIYGLPSAITLLAQYVLDKNIELSNIKAVLCGSEGTNSTQRELIWQAFNAKFYSWYGQTEKVVLGGECEHSPEYHLFSEYGYTELIDDDLNVIREPGQRGEIIGTGFINMAMPLLRYRTGDFAEYSSDEKCACGRKYIRISTVIGRRTDQYLVDKNREKILFNSLETQISVFSHVAQWQFIQEKEGFVQVNILKNNKITCDDIKSIKKELVFQVEGKIDFSISLVDVLQKTEMGKVKPLIQKIST